MSPNPIILYKLLPKLAKVGSCQASQASLTKLKQLFTPPVM